MKEFQSVVKEFILDRKNHMRYIAFLTFMCVIVSIAVPFSLIKPAISQTGELSCGIEEHTHNEDCYALICEDTFEEHEHTEECYQNICGFQEHIHTQECYKSIDEDINDYVLLNEDKPISNIFNGFTMVGTGATSPNTNPYTLAGDGNSSITSFTATNSKKTDGNTIDKVLTDFTLKYKLNAFLFSSGTITDGTPIQYQLSDDILSKIEIPNVGFSGTFQDDDNIYKYDSDNQVAGHYTVDTTGLITITLTEEYYTKLNSSCLSVNGAVGMITFKAYTKRGADDTSDVTFKEDGLSGTITFPPKTVSISKTNVLNPQTGEITWTITIDNSSKLNLNGYTIKDNYINTNTNATISYEPTNTSLTTTLTKLESGGYKIVENGSDNTTRATKIKIEYKTTLGSPDAYQFPDWGGNATESNTAQLFDASNNQVGSDVTSYCNINPVTINKSPGNLTDNKIPWTITISNPSGLDLTNYTLSDTYIKDNTNVNITYEPTNTTIQLQKNNDTYKFVETATNNKIRATKIIITYNTDISNIVNPFENGSIKNTATIQGGSNNSYSKSATDTFSYTGVSLSKSGSLDENTGIITWNLKVNNQLGLNLEGFTITDDKFPSDFNNSLGTYDSSTHTFTFNSTTSQYITLTYTTKLSDDVTNLDATGGDVSNSATIKKGTYSQKKNASVHYNGVSISSKSGDIADDGTITWTININNPNGINIGGYTITDTKFNSTYNPNLTSGSNYGKFNDDKTLFTFNKNVTDKNITLTYTTQLNGESDDIKSNGGTITNTAILKNGNTEISKGQGSVTVSTPISVTKTGVYDYQYNANNTTYPVNNQIVWTIHVKANYGGNLAGQTIQDSMFSGKALTDLGLTDKSNQLVINGNTLTINDNATDLTELTIVYTAPKDTTSNTVNVGSYNATGNVTGDYKPYTISKSASSVVDTLVTWTITVYNNTIADSLNGLIVTDTMFSSDKRVGNITVDNNATFTLSNNNLTLNVGSDVKQVTITYQTKATDTSNNTTNPTNTAKLKKGGTSYGTASATQPDYTPVNTITKSYISDTLNDTTGGTIDWNIVVKKDLGFQNSNVVITDNISANDSNATHTINGQQLKNLKVYYSNSTQDGATYTELSNSCYTIQNNDGNTIDLNSLDDTTTYTNFKIAFNNSIDSNIVNIKVEYSTTADITSVAGDTTVTFTNQASVTGIDNPSNATKEVTKFNANNQPFKKYAVDFSGESNTAGTIIEGSPSRLLSDLSTIDYNGTKYYIFTWAIFFDCANMSSSSLYTLEDTLPTNFELCTDETYQPKTVWPNNNASYNTPENGIYSMYQNEYAPEYYNISTNADGTQKITFSSSSNSSSSKKRFYVMYSAKISEENLNSLFANSNETTISNTVSAPNDATWQDYPYTNTQTIKKENTPSGGNTSEDILDKTVNTIPGIAKKLHYSIDVNPEAKTLSSDGNLVLNDIFNITGYKLNGQEKTTDLDISQFSIDVTSFKVYEVDSNGTKTEISNSEYSYVLSSPKTTYTPVECTITQNSTNSYGCNSYKIQSKNGNLVSGCKIKVTVSMNGDPWSLYKNSNLYLYNSNWNDITNSATKIINENDVTFEFTTSSSEDFIIIQDNWYGNYFSDINVEIIKPITENFAKRIQMVVPDGKHLCIDYYYNVSFNGDGIISGDYVSTSNTISIDTGNYSDSKTASKNVDMMSDNSSGITTATLPKIQKYDVGNYSIHLEAGFNIAKWNGSKWQYAQTMNEVTENGKVTGHELGTLGDTAPTTAVLTTDENGEYPISLESGVLYKLEEVNAPEKYNKLSKPMYFVSGSKSSITNIPSEAINIIDISNTGGLNVPNNKNINITVQKDWSGGTHTSDNVVVQLYKSTSKVATTEELEPVIDSNGDTVTQTLDNVNSWKATFEGYPNGDDDGNPLYYYVKEISYTVGEKTYTLNSTTNKYEYTDDASTVEIGEYTPYYTDNAVNNTNIENPVKILNTTGLKVEKVWYNANNVEITPPTDSIQFKLFYTLEGTTEKILYNNTNSNYETSTDGIFTLGTDNNWKLELNLPATIDDKKCTYSVEEINLQEGYTVSYVSNSDGNTGTIQIINKNPNGPETFNLEVEKQWADGNINHNDDSVTLELWRKSSSTDAKKVQDITLNKDNWQKSIPVEAYQVDDSGNYVTDINGNKIKYEYYVVETKINDTNVSDSTYTVTYNNTTDSSTSPNIDIDTNSKTIIVTNTNQATNIKLNITKNWSDNGNHNPIKVKVYRSTDSSKVPEVTEETTTTTTTTTEETTTTTEPAPETVTYTFNGLQDGDTITSVTLSDGTSVTVTNNTITVPKDTTSINYTIVRTQTFDNITSSTEKVNFSSNDDTNGCTFTFNNQDVNLDTEYSIDNTSSNTLTITKTVTNVSITEGNNITVSIPTINCTNTDKFNSSDSISGNLTDTSKMIDINLDNTKSVQSFVITINDIDSTNEYRQFYFYCDGWTAEAWITCDNNSISFNQNQNCDLAISGNTITIKFNNSNISVIHLGGHQSSSFNISYTVNYNTDYETDGQINEYSSSYGLNRLGFNSVMATNDNNTLTFTPTTENNSIEVAEITINSNNWNEVIGVPKADANGNNYYYWVIEDLTDNGLSTAYRSPQYSYNNDSNSYYISGADGSVTITNTKIDNTTSLPMTGGTGTTRYYLIGGTIVTFATVLLLKKRKNSKTT